MRIVISLLLVAICTGCVPFRSDLVAPETYEISTPISLMNSYNGAVVTLDYRSHDICPTGYDKLAERTTRKNGNEVLYWTIRCR